MIEKARERILELLEKVNMHYIPSSEMSELTYENYFVAKIDGLVVGFSGYKQLSADRAKTELMAVDPKYRGLKIGYKLQRKRMADMYDKGVRTLITNCDLPATISWYQKHFGYKIVGELKKTCEFGDPNINYWTTLETDLTSMNLSIIL